MKFEVIHDDGDYRKIYHGVERYFGGYIDGEADYLVVVDMGYSCELWLVTQYAFDSYVVESYYEAEYGINMNELDIQVFQPFNPRSNEE